MSGGTGFTPQVYSEVPDNPGTGALKIADDGMSFFDGSDWQYIIKSMTTTERDALTAAEGMTIYNETTHKLNVYTGSAWEVVTSS